MAYGFSRDDDLLAQLLALNLSIAEQEKDGLTEPRRPGNEGLAGTHRTSSKEKGSAPGKTRVRLRTDPTKIPFTLSRGAPTAPTSVRLWTPDQGPSGLLHRD